DSQLDLAEAGAAERLRHVDALEAELGHPLPDRPIEAVLSVHQAAHLARRRGVLEEAADRAAQLLLLLREGQLDQRGALDHGSVSSVVVAGRQTTSASSTSAASPAAQSGFTSSVSRSSPRPSATAARATATSATRRADTGWRPRAPFSRAAPRSSPSASSTSSVETGSRRRLVSRSTSTQMPPRPTASTGPQAGSRRTLTSSSTPP